jgi:hypothetical protein
VAGSAPPIVTGTTRPPAGGTVAAAPPPCSELKPLIDRYLTDAKITREAPGKQSSSCYVIGAFQGARVDAQLQYGRGASDKALRAATGAGCSGETHPLELSYPTALGCDNPTGGGHSGAGLAKGASFAVAAVTVTGDAAGTVKQRAALTDAAQKLAADVLQRLG